MTKHEAQAKNDSINKKGSGTVDRILKESTRKKELLKDSNVKSKTLDYIFGNSDENPLKT